MKKKLLLFVASLLPLVVNADAVKVGDLYYNFVLKAKIASVAPCEDEGEYNEYGDIIICYKGDIVIPPTVEYKGVVCNVTSIEDEAFVAAQLINGVLERASNRELTSVTIPESVTSIGNVAFGDCIELTSVSFPESINEIGESVFSGCEKLSYVKLPSCMTKIPGGLFAGCTSLVTLENYENITEIGSAAFANCKNLPSIDLKNVEKIGTYAFYKCSGITSITMSDNLKKIDQEAFRECTNLSTIKWSENLREISTGAFWYCKALESVELPNNVKYIGAVAFRDCNNLTTVKIGPNVLKIDMGAFAYCKELTDIYFYGKLPDTDEENTGAQNGVFYNSMVEYSTIHVPAGFISYCKETSPWNKFGEYLPLSDEEIGLDPEKSQRIIKFEDPQVKALCVSNWDLNGDGELSEAEAALPTSFSNIALWDTDNNGELNSEEIRNANNSASYTSVFSKNTKIKSFDELKYFTGLKYFTETGMKCIEVNAFYGCTNLTKVTLPEEVTIIDHHAFSGCTSLSSVKIPDNVISIGYEVFMNCNNLTAVTIGKKVQKIDYGAFSGCFSLPSVTIPDNVTTIGDNAFIYCTNLASVTLPSSITKIGSQTFYGCTSLTTVTIPSSVNEIGEYAFWDSGLTTITIPRNVKNIGSNAFLQLPKLEEVRSLIKDPFPFDDYPPFPCESAPLYVPAGTKAKYESTSGWNMFKTIIDNESIVKHIMGENPEKFDEDAADLNGDNEVNVVDIVELNNMLKEP